MRNDKHLAIALRKKGESYAKISKELHVAKSTLSEWFSGMGWSAHIKKELTEKASYAAKRRFRLLVKKRTRQWEKWREGFRKEARDEFLSLVKNPLFVAGINLYWGEGDGKMANGRVQLANVDPRMIKLFAGFIRKVLKVPEDKIRAWIILYPDLSEKECKQYWSKTTGIAPDHFLKTQFIKGRHPTKKIEHGICELLVYSRGLKEKIFTWISLFCEEMQK